MAVQRTDIKIEPIGNNLLQQNFYWWGKSITQCYLRDILSLNMCFPVETKWHLADSQIIIFLLLILLTTNTHYFTIIYYVWSFLEHPTQVLRVHFLITPFNFQTAGSNGSNHRQSVAVVTSSRSPQKRCCHIYWRFNR